MYSLTLFALDLLPASVALVLALALTPTVRGVARRRGIIASPKSDRWHKKPTALLGGIAIFLAFAVAWLAFAPRFPADWAVFAGATWLFLVGLVDDLAHLRPLPKLIGQLLGAALGVSLGLRYPWTGIGAVDIALTAFWLVGITNALNLLDNMDGLSAGVAAIAAAFFAAHALGGDWLAEAVAFATFAAALVGFLAYNSHPASIFMGDCGSLFIGFFLAGGALWPFHDGRAGRWQGLFVPVLVLTVPILDTSLVTIARKLSGRAISQGGRDHCSHRLVALGLSERAAVWTLYGLAALSGGVSLAVVRLDDLAAGAVVGGYLIALAGLGYYLGRIQVYERG